MKRDQEPWSSESKKKTPTRTDRVARIALRSCALALYHECHEAIFPAAQCIQSARPRQENSSGKANFPKIGRNQLYRWQMTRPGTHVSGTSLPSRRTPLPCVFRQQNLTQADDARGDFDVLVGLDIFERGFQRHLARRTEQNRVVRTGGADVGELLFFARVDRQIIVARIFADDHAFVHFVAGLIGVLNPNFTYLDTLG